ncbi:MAG TPA: glycoside hydrolase family 15 protein [Patescibacteria group bacterium]|nr:glycoside hydrolase family 15 protein [Patescibacteria group bacterium]
MPKYACLGNGNMLIGYDRFGQVKDLYFHYPGLENHIDEYQTHKIGIFVDGALHWLDGGKFGVVVEYENDTMSSVITAESKDLGIKLIFKDVVYNEKNVFVRDIEIINLYDVKRSVKIFFNQQFNISQTHTGDTAYYDPFDEVIIHYKGRRVFLINLVTDKDKFDDYSVGILGLEGKEGTFKDAEDGILSKNPIEHGQVDSVISMSFEIPPKKSQSVCYFMTVGKSISDVKSLNLLVLKKTPSYILRSTQNYWRAWVKNQNFSFYSLSDEIINLFNKSLLFIRTHVADNGAILASCDSDMLFYGRDTYSYIWPRDGAISALALAKAGDFNASRRFFEFCRDVISPEGYFLQKYRPDKSLGSSWHAWVSDGKPHLPIQEDGTALIILALWKYYELSKDLEFIESVYNDLIKISADFMTYYTDSITGLPKPSYDLWEMKYGISTFTSSTVYGALEKASKFAEMLGKTSHKEKYKNAAETIKNGILKHLYDQKNNYFYKQRSLDGGLIDETIDVSSFYGLYRYKVLPFDDPLLVKAHEVMKKRLSLNTNIGGIARFEGDIYHNPGGNIPGNPWIITTLWSTQYKLEFVKSESELPEIVKDFTWVAKRALASGVLPEQVNAYTGESLSATPLTWSHAEYVITVVDYLEKLEELGICKACYPIK